MDREIDFFDALGIAPLGWLEGSLLAFVVIFCLASIRWGWWLTPPADTTGEDDDGA